MDPKPEHLFARQLRLGSTLILAGCLAVFIAATIHWPLLGDASLMHYAVFLVQSGGIPYKDIFEINFPGSYFVVWSAMHLFGAGDLAWRLFDLSLMLTAIAAMVAILWPVDWFAGIWAGSLFLLLHGRDGMEQLGQRDMLLAVCILVAFAMLLIGLRRERPQLLFIFGLLAGISVTIKPTMLPLGIVCPLVAYWQRRRAGGSAFGYFAWGLAGLPLAPLCAALYLWHKQALTAFLGGTAVILNYHAGLARHSIGFLMLHVISPLLPLVIVWLLLCILRRETRTHEGVHILIALACGLLSYIWQGKGYAYQRYPLLAFLLIAMASQFSMALRGSRFVRVLGIAGSLFGVLFLAPVSTAMAVHYGWRNLGMVGMLEDDLRALGSKQLTGGVQCIDSISGCANVLYRLRLKETSAVFYDEFLFGPATSRAIELNRAKLTRDLAACPPSAIVVTDWLFPSGPASYEKLKQWPEFSSYLDTQYRIAVQRTPQTNVHWWGRSEVPPGYRIYLRRSPLACTRSD